MEEQRGEREPTLMMEILLLVMPMTVVDGSGQSPVSSALL